MTNMYFQIKNDNELLKIHHRGLGFILNDYPEDKWRTLHHASCDDITRSKTTYGKFFFSTREEAFKWLAENRGNEGEKWHCCGHCGALGQKFIGEIDRDLKTKGETAFKEASNNNEVKASVFRESKVQSILVNYLEQQKYNVKEKHKVVSGLIDIVADKDDELIIIEVKGEDKGGYTSAEMNFMMGIGQIISRMTAKNANYALAFPLTLDFKKVLRKYKSSYGFKRLDLGFYIVQEDGKVEFYNAISFEKLIKEL